jgi:hypothetical protein
MQKFVKYLIDKANGDISFVKKQLKNAATISHEEGDMESFKRESLALQEIEVLQANKVD